jgi:uncharacterized protein
MEANVDAGAPVLRIVHGGGNRKMEEKIVYFERPGRENTEDVMELVLERAESRNIKRIVVASTRGNTAKAFFRAFEEKDARLVVVPWQFGFKESGNPFPSGLAGELREKGHQVHFGTMLFHTMDFYGTNVPKVMANLLRTFGQGTKVCIEIMMMACDGGCIGDGERVIAVAGTGSGADTALLASVAPSNRMTSLRIHEIICKPIL